MRAPARTATAPASSRDVTQRSPAPRLWRWHVARGPLPINVRIPEVVTPSGAGPVREHRGSTAYDWVSASAHSMHDARLAPSDFGYMIDEALRPSGPADATHDADLQSALSDLRDVGNEARDEGLTPPSDEGLHNAERLLRSMYVLRRCRFEIYPAEHGEVAVYAPGGHGRSVLVLCDSAGGVRCFVNLSGRHRRAVYDSDSAANLPDGFVREALAALDRK